MTEAIGLSKSNYTCPLPISSFAGLEKKGITVASHKKDENLDQDVIDSFGHEWATFDYGEKETTDALNAQFKAYCTPIELSQFNPKTSVAADFGAGSGRWASRLIPFFSLVYALEPSDGASKVLKNKFADEAKIVVLQETVGANSIPLASLDLAMSLGVLHHIPDTALAIKDVSNRIKPGGVFLCYLYYNLENKPTLYKLIFRGANVVRKIISRLPQKIKHSVSSAIAALVYWPLARFSKVMKRFGVDTSNFPLHHYADMPFVMLANDALDRFGTSLEQRFSKTEITEMLRLANFDTTTLNFSDDEPFWTFSVIKKK
jgi:SAM-dependent methyltransferase